MKIDIHYCQPWNYEPRAASVADELQKAFDVKATLIPGKGGIFDVIVDGVKVFSKHDLGRFPEPGEVVGEIKQ